MNIETLDQLETILGATKQGFKFEPLIEAVSNDDDSRIAGDIYRLLFTGKPDDLAKQVEALRESFAVYYRLDEQDDAKSVLDRENYGDFKREVEKAA